MKQNIEGNLQEDAVLYVNGLPVMNCGQFTQVGILVMINSHRAIAFPVSRRQAVDFLVQLHVLDFPFQTSIITIKVDSVVPEMDFNEWTLRVIEVIGG